MTTIQIDGADALVHVEGFDQFLALTSRLRIPLKHIAGVDLAGEEAHAWFHGIRFPGSNIPGVLSAGTFYEHQGRVFWDVHDPDKAIEIRLHDEDYVKLILEVEDPAAAIATLRAALPAA
jgi:hypothetical protein